jgi:hypothetical protein
MDEGASVRLKEDEIKKLKAARARDAERTKTAALKNKTKALADQKRAQDLHAAELRKEVEDLKIFTSSHRKDEERWGRKVARLERQLAESGRACEQGCIDLKWLRTEHEEAQRKMAILKKERGSLKLEVICRRRDTDRMKERHRDKFKELKDQVVEWRDNTLAEVVSTKVWAGKHAPFTGPFEHFSRGMLATGTSASTCVDTVTRCRNCFLKGKARGAIVIPRKCWFSKMRKSVGHVAWLCAAMSIAGAAWILQFGFDETQITREGPMNHWALIWVRRETANRDHGACWPHGGRHLAGDSSACKAAI